MLFEQAAVRPSVQPGHVTFLLWQVLVEKPVLQWPSVRAAAETACGWVHVGFQRRRDTEYMRAKRHCERHRVSSAVFLAEDPWDAEQDTEADARTLCGVLRNSLCHEFDLLHWLWPGGHVALLRVGLGSLVLDGYEAHELGVLGFRKTCHIDRSAVVDRPASRSGHGTGCCGGGGGGYWPLSVLG